MCASEHWPAFSGKTDCRACIGLNFRLFSAGCGIAGLATAQIYSPRVQILLNLIHAESIMNPDPSAPRSALAKASTGIDGFDEMTNGGLPRGRTTLLVGGPGSGKTVFALQFLVHGAKHCQEPGILVAFEEASERIAANAQSFGWNIPQLQNDRLCILDAQPSTDLVHSGTFDLGGMLAALDAQTRKTKARRIVFDALDVVLALLPDAQSKQREVNRLHEWLLASGMTGIITSKADAEETYSISQKPFDFMHFMVDCAVILNHRAVQGVSLRSLRVQKFRGSGFDENEAPFLIGEVGLQVAVAHSLGRADSTASDERISSGVKPLDAILGGGYFRGASVLISGAPGTAKTTLSGAFAQAACGRGERTLIVCFDSNLPEVIRNLASVGIQLNQHIENGSLRMVSVRTITGSAESYLGGIQALVKEHKANCLVIDPVTLSRTGNELTAHSVAVRLIDSLKAERTTLVCTSRIDELLGQTPGGCATLLSTLADTWIHLAYVDQAGLRARGLSIVKSRGTAHSNQLHTLTLDEAGISLCGSSAS